MSLHDSLFRSGLVAVQDLHRKAPTMRRGTNQRKLVVCQH